MGWFLLAGYARGVKFCQHRIASLVRQYFIWDSNTGKHFLCNMFSIDIAKRHGLEVTCRIIADDQNVAITRTAARKRSHNVHAYPTEWLRHNWQ